VNEIVVVILDMTMPEMNGEEAFLEIRRIRSPAATCPRALCMLN
jgi:DNA-binding NarL/FixJ family response regulator